MRKERMRSVAKQNHKKNNNRSTTVMENQKKEMEIVVTSKNSPTVIAESSVPDKFKAEVENALESKGPDVAASTVLMYILTNSSDLSEAISSFYIHGTAISQIFRKMDLSKIVKDIYNHYGVQLAEKVEGVIGVTDTNVYLFDLLGEKLPELYADGKIKTRPIDDLMNPQGLLTVLMTAIQENKANILHQIKNLSKVQNQFSGKGENEQNEDVIENYLEKFQNNLNKVSGMFEKSDINYLHSMMKEFGNMMSSSDLVVGNSPVKDEEWAESMGFLLATIVEEQKEGAGTLSEIYTMLKSGKHLPNPSVTEVVDEEVIKTAVKEAIIDTQNNDDNDEKRKNTIKDAMKEVILEFEKSKEEEVEIDQDQLMESLKKIGGIDEIKETLKEIQEKAGNEPLIDEKRIGSIEEATDRILKIVEQKENSSNTSEEMVLSIKELRDEFATNKKILSEDVLKAIEGVGEKIQEMPDAKVDKNVVTLQDAEHIKRELIEEIEEKTQSLKTFLEQMIDEEDEDEEGDTAPSEIQVQIKQLSNTVEGIQTEIMDIKRIVSETYEMIKEEVEESIKIREEIRSEAAHVSEKKGKTAEQKPSRKKRKQNEKKEIQEKIEDDIEDKFDIDEDSNDKIDIEDDFIEELEDEY